MDLKGIYTALLTSFDKDSKLNAKVLKEVIDHNLKLGVDGFFVGGSTSEAFMLSFDQRREIMELAKAQAPNAKLIAHVGCIDEEETLKLARCAKQLGYHAVSAVPPFYYKFGFKEIKQFFLDVADAAELPFFIYHFPNSTGVNFTIEQFAELLEDDRIAGLKFTCNDVFLLEQIKRRFPNKIVYNGYDELFIAGVVMGVDGGVGSTYNFMADKFIAITRLMSEGKVAEAQKIQHEANRIIEIICKIGLMPAEKEILNQLGFDFGTARKPFKELSAEEKDLIRTEVIPYITAR